MTTPALPFFCDRMTLEWLPGRFVVCRFAHDQPLPRWIAAALESPSPDLLCVTRLQREIAVVIDEQRFPTDIDRAIPVQRDFIAFRIAGIVDFSLIGVLARLTGALAEAGVSVVVISTYDTDIVMVRECDRVRAEDALRRVAHIAPGATSRRARPKD